MNSGYKKASDIKKRFLLCSSLFSLTIVSVSWFLVSVEVTAGLFAGFLIGLSDNFIMFLGIQEGSLRDPAKAVATMKKNMLKRIAFVALAFFVAIKAGMHMLALFIAFLSIHIVCLVFVILYAKGNALSAERSEKDVGREPDN